MFYLQKQLNLTLPNAKLHGKRKRLPSNSIFALILSFILTACQTYQFEDEWPEELPPRKVFIKGYLENRGLKTAPDSELSYHLTWVKRFYQGTTLYPRAWLYASDRFRDSIEDDDERRKVKRRMYELGITIANDWAQDNDIRHINNNCISIWASAMQTAAERDQQLAFLDKVELDVEELLAGDLKAEDIEYSRYFEEQIYDDF